jgi:hypothetical protein
VLASGSRGRVSIWGAQTGEQARTLEHSGWVRAVAFSPCGGMLLAGHSAGATGWRSDSWLRCCSLRPRGPLGSSVNAVGFSPCGGHVALGSGASCSVYTKAGVMLVYALRMLRRRLQILHSARRPVVRDVQGKARTASGRSQALWIERVCSCGLLPSNVVEAVLAFIAV